MKLVFAIVQNEDSKKLIKALTSGGFPVTKIASTGGFMQGGNTTLMMGLEDEMLNDALELVKKESKTRKRYTVVPQATMPGYIDTNSAPIQVTVGGAVVFIVDVWRYEHY